MSNKIYSFDELKDVVGKILSEFPIKKATLFGSYAKGNAHSKSDIDLLIDSDGKLKGINFYGVLESLVQSLGKNVDLIEQRQIIKNSKLEKEILETGVVIYGK